LQLVVIKVIDANGFALDDVVAEGIDAAVSVGAQVISMSLAGAGYSQTLQTAMDSAWEHNVLVVAAAGNNEQTTLTYPGDGNHVLTVSATASNNQVASFSNYGEWVKIAAPGQSVESTLPTYANSIGTNYGQASGTSMATSIVAALAGLLYAVNPNLSAATIAQRIQQTAQTPNSGWNQYIGYGIISAGAALAGTPGTATQGSFTGQVVDSSNNPINGAVVSVGNQSYTTISDPTTGSPTGLFRVANLSPGTYPITVTASGYTGATIQGVIVAGADTMLTIPLNVSLGEFTGTVTSNSVGIAGAVVEALSGNPGVIQATAVTNATGSYTLYVPSGTYTLLATAPNYNNATSGAESISAGTVTVNLPLTAFGNISGTVTDVNGLGVAGAHIDFTDGSFSGGTETGAGGSYSTFGIPAGTYTVTASASGFPNTSYGGTTVTNGVSTQVNFQFSTGIGLTSGLLCYWPFNEGSGAVAHDQSGNGHNATLSSTTWTTGLFNYGLSFNGSSSLGSIPSIPLTVAFSISTWVNPTVTSQSSYAALAQVESAGGFYLGVDSTGTQYKFVVNNGSGSTGSCAFGGIALGCAQGGTVTTGWHLITGTYDGTTGILYVDGVMVASDTFTATAAASVTLEIGRNYSSGSTWNGVLNGMRLYNRALTAEEVSNIFGQAVLGLAKTADAAAVTAGTPIGFTLAVTNNGTITANTVSLLDPLPTGSGINWSISPAYSGPGTCFVSAGALSCIFGNLASSASASVHITSATSTSSCKAYANTATVSAGNVSALQSTASSSVQCSISCTVSGDSSPSVADVQMMINEALGLRGPSNDLNFDGIISVTDVQIVINAVLGKGCV